MEKLLVFNLYQVSCPELTWHPPCVSYNAHENEIYYEMPENFQFYIDVRQHDNCQYAFLSLTRQFIT